MGCGAASRTQVQEPLVISGHWPGSAYTPIYELDSSSSLAASQETLESDEPVQPVSASKSNKSIRGAETAKLVSDLSGLSAKQVQAVETVTTRSHVNFYRRDFSRIASDASVVAHRASKASVRGGHDPHAAVNGHAAVELSGVAGAHAHVNGAGHGAAQRRPDCSSPEPHCALVVEMDAPDVPWMASHSSLAPPESEAAMDSIQSWHEQDGGAVSANASAVSMASQDKRELASMDVDFNEEGRKLLIKRGQWENPEGESSGKHSARKPDLDALWVHPLVGAVLYVGSERMAKKRDVLKSHAITRVVVCLDSDGDDGPFDGEEGFRYLYFPIGKWRDARGLGSHRGMAKVVAPLLGFVAEALEEGQSVLIHCLAGAHRAGTAGVLCLMHLCNVDCDAALAAARAERDCIELLGHLSLLAKRVSKALSVDAVRPAIELAARQGFQQATVDVYGEHGPCRRRAEAR